MFTLRNRWDYFVLSVLFSLTIPRFSLCILLFSWQSWDALLLILFMWTNEPKYGLDRQSRHEVLSCVSLTYFSNRLGCDVFDDTVCRAPTEPERYSFEKWTEKRRRTCKKRQLSTEAILWQTCRWAHSIVRFSFRFCFRFFVIVDADFHSLVFMLVGPHSCFVDKVEIHFVNYYWRLISFRFF